MLGSYFLSLILESVSDTADFWRLIVDEFHSGFDRQGNGNEANREPEHVDGPPRSLVLLTRFVSSDEFKELADELEDYLELGYRNKEVLGISRFHFMRWQTTNLFTRILIDRLRNISNISSPWKRISK